MKESILSPIGRFSNGGLLLARGTLCWLFIWAGYNKIISWDWATHFMASHGVPLVTLLLTLSLVVEFVGGVMLLIGFRTRWASTILALYLLPATLFFHQFWQFWGMYGLIQQAHFMGNVAICGGLLLLAVAGPGRYSLDARDSVWIRNA